MSLQAVLVMCFSLLHTAIGSTCSYNAADPSKISFDSASKTLTCNDEANKLMAIKINSKLYKSLKCDDSQGWMNGSETITAALTPVNVKCVEYCAVATTGDAIPNTIQSGMRSISCLDNPQNVNIDDIVEKNVVLFVNDTPLPRADIYAICNFENGWNQFRPGGHRPYSLSIDTKIAMRAECKRACVQITPTNDVKATPMRNSLINATEFNCNKLGRGYGIRVNGGAVYPKIYCSVRGFTLKAFSDDSVVSAFEPVNLDCAPDDAHPRSTKSSILAISIYSIIFILIGNGNL